MLGLLAEVAVDIALHVAGAAFRSALAKTVVPVRKPRLVVTANQLAERRVAYARWAMDRDFEQDDVRSHIYRGEKSGRRIRFLTGLGHDTPTLPELEIEHASPGAFPAIVVRPDAPRPAGVGRAIAAIVDLEQVVQVDVTRTLVRICYEPMVAADLLDEPLEGVLRALSPTTTSAYR